MLTVRWMPLFGVHLSRSGRSFRLTEPRHRARPPLQRL